MRSLFMLTLHYMFYHMKMSTVLLFIVPRIFGVSTWTYMLDPELADNDVMYTAVDVLPGIRLVVSVNTPQQLSLQHTHTASVYKHTASYSNFRGKTSGYATWFTAGGAIRIAHYDVTDDVKTWKL